MRRDGRSLDSLVRLACSTDPDEPVRRPRRTAVAPRAAMILGAALVALALLLALRTVMTAPGSRPQAGPAATATAGAEENPAGGSPPAGPATGTGAAPSSGPGRTGVETGGTGELLVHVVGAVRAPGVVRLPAGARVVDAIEAAGGVREDAQTDQLNLARLVADGEQVRVPVVGEVVEAVPSPEEGATPSAGGTASGSGPINVNTASATELERLPGIGPALAERIVNHRQAHGPFASLDDLTDVPGIGKAKLEALRAEATV